jgi:hypothetical protein
MAVAVLVDTTSVFVELTVQTRGRELNVNRLLTEVNAGRGGGMGTAEPILATSTAFPSFLEFSCPRLMTSALCVRARQ